MCAKFFTYFLLSFFIVTCSAMEYMEQETNESIVSLLSEEIIVEIFSYIVHVSENQTDFFTTIQAIPLVHSQWHKIINDKKLNKHLTTAAFYKFAFLEEPFNFLALLYATRNNKALYQESLAKIKTIAQYAVLHHNELALHKEIQYYPWSDIPMGGYCNAMRKSYNAILFQQTQGKNITKLSTEIADEYNHLKVTTEPILITSNYQPDWDPYRITAELMHCADNTKKIIEAVFNECPNLSEKIVQFSALLGDFDSQFTHHFVWQPTFLRICSNSNQLNEFIEQSKLLYKFN